MPLFSFCRHKKHTQNKFLRSNDHLGVKVGYVKIPHRGVTIPPIMTKVRNRLNFTQKYLDKFKISEILNCLLIKINTFAQVLLQHKARAQAAIVVAKVMLVEKFKKTSTE